MGRGKAVANKSESSMKEGKASGQPENTRSAGVSEGPGMLGWVWREHTRRDGKGDRNAHKIECSEFPQH